MARLMRIQDPDFIYHVSTRSEEAKFLFVPDDELNPIAHRILCAAVRIYRIELYAFVLMANHPHFLLRAPLMNLHLFMGYFQSNLSTQVNCLRKRFDATVFVDRFAAEPILDVESLEEKIAYVLCNPVAANLVERPEHYPGITSYAQSAGLQTAFALPLTRIPLWHRLDDHSEQAAIRGLVEPTIQLRARQRKWPVMGAERVKRVPWWKRPRRPRRGSKAVCHGATKEVRIQYANYVNSCHTRYRNAVLALRSGELLPFPYGMIPPGCREASRCEPHRRLCSHLRLANLRAIDTDLMAG